MAVSVRDRDGFLVVGGDSLVGGRTVLALERRGALVLASTRRRETVNARRVYLDFESDAPFRAPPEVGHALIIAAATDYNRCEKDPLTHHINAQCIPRLAASLLRQGLFVTFISTNAVFGGECPEPAERRPPHENTGARRLAFAGLVCGMGARRSGNAFFRSDLRHHVRPFRRRSARHHR